MLKLKAPLRASISKLVQYYQMSCDVQNDHESTTKNVMKQNEILTDKFRKQLSYIIERNKHPTKYQPLEKSNIFSTEETVTEQHKRLYGTDGLTNVTDSLPNTVDFSEIPVQASLETSFSEEENEITLKKVSNSSMDISDFTKKILPIVITPALMESAHYPIVLSKENQLSNQVDLSTAVVPLSLHSRDNNLLVDSLVEDMYKLYYNTSETVCCWSLVLQNQSQLCYIELNKFFNKPDTPQNFLREELMSQWSGYKEKTAIWLCQAKEPTEKKTEKPEVPAAPKPNAPAEPGPFEKIMKVLDNIMSSIKQKIEESKKKSQESKSK